MVSAPAGILISAFYLAALTPSSLGILTGSSCPSSTSCCACVSTPGCSWYSPQDQAAYCSTSPYLAGQGKPDWAQAGGLITPEYQDHVTVMRNQAFNPVRGRILQPQRVSVGLAVGVRAHLAVKVMPRSPNIRIQVRGPPNNNGTLEFGLRRENQDSCVDGLRRVARRGAGGRPGGRQQRSVRTSRRSGRSRGSTRGGSRSSARGGSRPSARGRSRPSARGGSRPSARGGSRPSPRGGSRSSVRRGSVGSRRTVSRGSRERVPGTSARRVSGSATRFVGSSARSVSGQIYPRRQVYVCRGAGPGLVNRLVLTLDVKACLPRPVQVRVVTREDGRRSVLRISVRALCECPACEGGAGQGGSNDGSSGNGSGAGEGSRAGGGSSVSGGVDQAGNVNGAAQGTDSISDDNNSQTANSGSNISPGDATTSSPNTNRQNCNTTSVQCGAVGLIPPLTPQATLCLRRGVNDVCAAGDGPSCSGHGVCVCGECVCSSRHELYPHQLYSGTHCQCDDYGCGVSHGGLCGGPTRGRCQCGQCVCHPGWSGDTCEMSTSVELCIGPDSGGEVCSGRGTCVNGLCECASRYTGAFCECDDLACPHHQGAMCGGPARGRCVCGACDCRPGYEGEACGQFEAAVWEGPPASCRAPGEDSLSMVCSGHGVCVSGSCVCSRGYSGTVCQDCPDC